MKKCAILCVFVAFLILINCKSEEDSFYVVKQYNESKYYCITKSSYALSWIDNRASKQESLFTNKAYFHINKETKKKFKQELSEKHILDRRWESMPVYTTYHNNYESKLTFTKVLEFNGDTEFIIPFSVRVKNEGHIYLCDGNNVSTSNCYWIIMQELGKEQISKIKRCYANQISPLNGILDTCESPSEDSNQIYLFSEKWIHLKIIKTEEGISLQDINKKTLISYTFIDNTQNFTVKTMFIRSKTIAFWKLHKIKKFEYEIENTDITSILLGKVNNYICLSVIIQCNSCKIKCVVKDRNNHILETSDPEIHPLKNSWKEIICRKEQVQNNVAVWLNLDQTNEVIISSIQECSLNGFRMIKLGRPATCQLMTPSSQFLSLETAISDLGLNHKCDEFSIGQNCLSCSMLFGHECGKLKFCEKNGSTITCTCSAGFKNVNDSKECSHPCEKKSYGHFCHKKCHTNCDDCDSVGGDCKVCSQNYEPPNCTTRATIFDSVSSNFNSVTVNIKNSQKVKTKEETLTFQYRESDDQTSDWILLNETYKTTSDFNILINNLKPGTLYALKYSNKNKGYFSDPFKFTTKCNRVTEKDFTFSVLSTSAIIALKNEALNTICPFNLASAKIEINPTVDRDGINSFNKTTVTINSLVPFTMYTITITYSSHRLTIKITTTEGVPEAVERLKVSNEQKSTIYLSWEKPAQIYGTFQHYIVTYGISRHLGCKENRGFSLTSKITKSESLEIRDLISYTEYTFDVSAVNTKFQGKINSIKHEIKSYKCLESTEIPEIKNVVPQQFKASVEFSLVNCTNLRGPIEFNYNIACLTNNGWCNNYTSNTNLFTDQHDLILSELKAFTNYQFTIELYRPSANCNRTIKHKTFKTLPDVPFAIKELSVYAKNNHSISLRWTAPSPPTGKLKHYNIEFYSDLQSSSSGPVQIVDASTCTCTLWSEYCCYTVSHLTANSSYNVDIKARNENVDRDGQSKTASAKTIIEPSKKPPNLTFQWTFENNLKLAWKHPIQANGDLACFNISVIEDLQIDQTKNPKLSFLKPIDNGFYKKKYHYSIQWKELKPNTQYKIVVQAFNGLDGKEAEVVTLSPPEIPIFKSNINFKTTNFSKKITLPKIKNYFSSHTYNVYIFVEKDTEKENCLSTVKNISEVVGNKLTGNVLFYECQIESNKIPLIVETNNNSSSEFCKRKCVSNEKIKHFKVLLVSSYKNASSYSLYDENSKISKTSQMTATNESLLYLLILLLFPLSGIIYIAIRYFKNRHSIDNSTKNEHPPKKSFSLKNIQDAKIPSEKIFVAKLREYVKKSFENGELDRQHELFPRGQTKSWDCGALKENKSKNRYNNLIAYDHTRVILDENKNSNHSDYINANYIDGYKMPRAYIATQGPKASTLDDFWQMIWQENVHHIAMLANVYEGGKKKVEKYWPDQNQTLQFTTISVHSISSTIHANYELRIFQVENEGELRTVHQYHFNSWPDHGVPLYSQSLIPFLQNLQNIALDSKSPLVVHCSAGVGRTGTIILCDISLRMAAMEGCVDLLKTLGKLREQRANMVDNATQYKLAHLVVLEFLFGVNTSIPCNEIEEKVDALMKSGGVRKQMQHLEETAWQDQLLKMEKSSAVVVEEKNRFQDIVPESQNILLPRYPSTDEKSTYINAVLVDGFEQTNRFIVTQQPMVNTLGDFWRLIHENDISVIVSLNEVNLSNIASCRFWPSKKTLQPVDYITLKCVKTATVETHKSVTIQLATSDNVFKQVEILALKDWPANTITPKKMGAFLSFMEDASNACRNSSAVVVTCFDGATASGLYVALSFILEKMKLEQVCDVCQAVRSIRHNRSQFVQSQEQFEFLYKAAVEYIKEFQFYANFN